MAGVFQTYVEAFMAKLNELTQYPTENIILAESEDFIGKPDSFFPRLEVVPLGFRDLGSRDQRNLEGSLVMKVLGYVRYDENLTEVENRLAMLDRGMEVKAKIFSMNTDKKLGVLVANGFQKIDASSDVAVETSYDQKMSGFLVIIEANFILCDETF